MPSLTFFDDDSGELVSMSGPSELEVLSMQITRLEKEARRERPRSTQRKAKVRSCSNCGAPGHYRNTCPALKNPQQGSSGKRCAWCADLGHRRPPAGCVGCGRPFVAEKVTLNTDRRCSSAGFLLEE